MDWDLNASKISLIGALGISGASVLEQVHLYGVLSPVKKITGWLCFLCFFEFFHSGTYARCFCWMVCWWMFWMSFISFRDDCFATFAMFSFFLFVPGCFAQIAWFWCLWFFWFVLPGTWCWMPSPGPFGIFAFLSRMTFASSPNTRPAAISLCVLDSVACGTLWWVVHSLFEVFAALRMNGFFTCHVVILVILTSTNLQTSRSFSANPF